MRKTKATLSEEVKHVIRSVFTPRQAERYIDIIELRNSGMSFRKIAKKRGTYAPSVWTAYRKVVFMFDVFEKYFSSRIK